MSPEIALAAAVALPFAGSLAVLLSGSRPNLRETMTLATGGGVLLAVVGLVGEVAGGARPSLHLLEVVPGGALAFAVEPLGMLFALVASGLWVVTSIYSIGYMRAHGEANQTRFYTCFALAIGAALGVAFAANLFTLFLFYELLTVSTYPLVTHHQTPEAMRAGRVYLGVLMATSIGFLLLAIVWTGRLAGTLDLRPGGILPEGLRPELVGLLLALFVFGTGKAAVMPFHRWLPAAMVAPTPVSALLHAVAVVKAGVFAVLKVAVYVFGVDRLRESGAAEWLMVVAAATIVIASIVAIREGNLKRRLAYSTISQLSYIVLAAALATGTSVVGGGLHIATHAVAKITLFFCAGAIYVATHRTEVAELDGLGRTMPFTMGAFLLGSLSIVGVPPFGGSWSKWLLVLGAAERHQQLLVLVLVASSLLSVAYLLPIVGRAFFLPPRDERAGGGRLREAPLLCLVPLCLTALGTLALFFGVDGLRALLGPLGE